MPLMPLLEWATDNRNQRALRRWAGDVGLAARPRTAMPMPERARRAAAGSDIAAPIRPPIASAEDGEIAARADPAP
jgi:hypothetical protein